jgi:hypothetical protein
MKDKKPPPAGCPDLPDVRNPDCRNSSVMACKTLNRSGDGSNEIILDQKKKKYNQPKRMNDDQQPSPKS